MKKSLRRNLLFIGLVALLGSCGPLASVISPLKETVQIDNEVNSSLQLINNEIPGTVDLQKEAKGVLIIPKITEANFWLGGAYGEGALVIGNAIVGYYNMAQASLGAKIGAQEYSHAIYFMTSDALAEFRSSDGWALGIDAEYVMAENSGWINEDVVKPASNIIALIFDRSGITLGGSMEGVKYSPMYKN